MLFSQRHGVRRTATGGCMAAMLIIAAGQTALAQSQDQGQVLIPGYLNPRTGAFRPHILTVQPLISATLYKGEFSITYKITIASTLPANQPVTCEATVTAVDALGTFYDYVVAAAATVTGAQGACTLTVPYAWSLGTTPTYSISGSVGSTSGTLQNLRSFNFPVVGATKFPANGAKTSYTLSQTL
jgi:hypothetical protein